MWYRVELRPAVPTNLFPLEIIKAQAVQVSTSGALLFFNPDADLTRAFAPDQWTSLVRLPNAAASRPWTCSVRRPLRR